MKILCAGNDTQGLGVFCKRYDLPKLHSFLNEQKHIEKWDGDKYSLMVDSGAHSWNKETITKVGMKGKKELKPAREFMETYYQFIKTWKDKKVVWVEFDVYGHLPTEEIDSFCDRVLALNIAGTFMRVYHPMLDNGDLSCLRKWISQGHKYIGVGNDSTAILPQIFNLTRNEIKLHGFAMTKLRLMEAFPFYSVDSTSPMSTVIFGRYTTPQMAFKERAEVIEEKSIECYHGNFERLENAIVETKRVQDYITEVWAKKGVIWND